MNYKYLAYDLEKKMMSGSIAAANEQEAARTLRSNGYQVVNLRSSSWANFAGMNMSQRKVNSRELLVFSRQLALFVESGVDLLRALELLQQHLPNPYFREVINGIVSDLREGSSFSFALSKHDKVFPRIYYRAIAAGEYGGNLPVILRQMADFLERGAETRKKLKGALTYPITVLIVAVIVVAVLVEMVLPTFVKLFKELGTALPPTTQALLAICNFLIGYGIYILLFLAIIGVAGFFYLRTPGGKYAWDSFSLKVPVIGPIIQLNELSYCARIMSLLFKVGLPPMDILNLALQGASNKVTVDSLSRVRDELVQGEGLAKPMSRRSIFPPLMVQMATFGENTGNLGDAMGMVAQSFEIESEERTRLAVGLIQPIMIVVIAGVVAFIAVSMISAMFGMYSAVGS